MALKEIAAQGATLKETFSGGQPSVASKQIVTPASSKVKVGGKGAYKGDIDCSYILTPPSGFDTPPTLPMTITIKPTAQKVKAEGDFVVLKGDKSMGSDAWNFSNAASGATIAGTITIEIDDPAQTKVKAQ